MPGAAWMYTLSLHDALPIWRRRRSRSRGAAVWRRRAVRAAAQRGADLGLRRLALGDRGLHLVEPRHALPAVAKRRSEEHTSELQSRRELVCRLLLEKKKTNE